jgi:hypothetical protein
MRWIQSAIREGGGRSPVELFRPENRVSDPGSNPSKSSSWSGAQGRGTLSGLGYEGEGLADALISTWRTSQQEQSASAEEQFSELQQHVAWISPSMLQE